ncbi:MAG: GTPase ObgE [Dehalococcoidales bacterium]|nr:GTPase ObgE [Dehalococcoidales bacterium]
MIDQIEIRIKAGDGGNGAVSFRREMYVPFGGPDGGNGGKGGDVIIQADNSTDTLREFKHHRLYKAENGHNGAGRKKYGRNGQDLILNVPAGTIITTEEDGVEVTVADLENAGDKIIIAEGGKGGWGNVHFKSSTNQVPRLAQKGEKGEEKTLKLEMRVIADVGVIGYPNAGKSTLLTAASAAKPKVADYPFTTLEPELGVVDIGMERFVLAEIPGLIEGAHLGKGLGHDFLRHTKRTKILIHIISGASDTPTEDLVRVNNELAMFDTALAQKPQIVAVNKIDLPEVQENLEIINSEFEGAGIKARYISAATGEGVKELMEAAFELLKKQAAVKKPEAPGKVFHPQPKEARVTVTKEEDTWVIHAPGLDRLYAGNGVTKGELRWQLNYQLDKYNVNSTLEKAGVKAGDKVRCGDLIWEWDKPGRKSKRIGILGGTFDPIHMGHLMIAEEAKAALDLSEVLLIPAGQPMTHPNEFVTAAKHRLEMAKLAAEEKPYLRVSTVEIERDGPSYTADTLAALRKKFGEDELYFILGWDSLAQLPNWHQPERIVGQCTLVAVPRPGYEKPSIRALENALPGIERKVIFLDKPNVDISATEVRKKAGRGESIDQLVPETVAKYISRHKLYQET